MYLPGRAIRPAPPPGEPDVGFIETRMRKSPTADPYRDFDVDTLSHVLGGLASRLTKNLVRLGNAETRMLAGQLRARAIRQPLFVTGLARAGTTLLLEYLASHDTVATHRYRDFPAIHTPFWWNRLLDCMPRRGGEAVERTHRDGIFVTPESPEAMEEMLWQTFFFRAHDPLSDNVLDSNASHPQFERFYREHILKLLMIRQATRYAAKNNYNLTRLGYLCTLFPDCRIVIMVRRPEAHVASLIKQHTLFGEGETAHPRALTYMRRAGHYEFGLDRRPINANDAACVRSVEELWCAGEHARGWARYWAHLYGYVVEVLEKNPAVRNSAMLVRFEELCDKPAATLHAVSRHCCLELQDAAVDDFAAGVRYPTYYRGGFTAGELQAIQEETAAVAGRLGYNG